VIYRLSVEDFFPGGLPFAEGRQIALWAAQGGADALHVTAGHYRSLPSAQVVLPPMIVPDGPFLDFAAIVKKEISVPVIAVGRLGDPALAESAVASGKTDFIALGRTLVADPQWVEKVARGEPIRRCLACNTCINDMRSGARIGCVVNGAAGRETQFADAEPPKGERIAVIGAGPAGLTYASLVADGSNVAVFEKDKHAGGSFRYAGKAPLFQEVEANDKSFARYIADMVAACEKKGVVFHFATDVTRDQSLLTSFDRIVIATGAAYRFGLGAFAKAALDSGAARWPGIARLMSNAKLRDWFYYRGRRATGDRFARPARSGQIVTVIGDAVEAGKSKQAITSAFEAALLRNP
jgi:dimethylglycine catabolism A